MLTFHTVFPSKVSDRFLQKYKRDRNVFVRFYFTHSLHSKKGPSRSANLYTSIHSEYEYKCLANQDKAFHAIKAVSVTAVSILFSLHVLLYTMRMKNIVVRSNVTSSVLYLKNTSQ